MSFLEARKIVGSYMGERSYASVSQRVDRTNDTNKYKTLMEKLIKLKANYWPKFQEHLNKIHSVKFYQAPAQQEVGNRERSNDVVQTKTHIGSITPTRTTPKSAKSPSKQPLHKSPIRSLKSIKDRLKNLSPIKSGLLKQKPKFPLSKLRKYRWALKWIRKSKEAHSKYPQQQSHQQEPNNPMLSNQQNPYKGRMV